MKRIWNYVVYAFIRVRYCRKLYYAYKYWDLSETVEDPDLKRHYNTLSRILIEDVNERICNYSCIQLGMPEKLRNW